MHTVYKRVNPGVGAKIPKRSQWLVLSSRDPVLNSSASNGWETALSMVQQTGRRLTVIGVGLTLSLMALLAGCSDDAGGDASGATCSETRCEAGAVGCFGNAVWTCDADGLGWDKEGCGALEACIDGACVDRECLIPGKRECDEGGEGGTVCSDDGMSIETFACNEDEPGFVALTCVAGVCPHACVDGEKTCGHRTLLVCQGGDWTEVSCGGSKLCVEDTEGARCVDWACQPGTATCDNGNSVTCDAEGRAETVTACSDMEICESGHCVTATCAEIEAGEAGAQPISVDDPTPDASGGADGGETPEDAGPEEVAPHPGLEPISRIDFKLNGIPNTFDLAAMADYSEAESRLVISGSDGSRKLEINLGAVEPFSVGVWTDTDDSETVVAVCYHDGTANETPPDGAGCSVGFSHAAILYSLEIATNNGDGSRVTGTFSTSLIDTLGTQLDFTEGTFDVLHK